MEFLWTKDLRINTVHVSDVTRAVWHAANWYVSNGKQGSSVIFNLADENDTGMRTSSWHFTFGAHCFSDAKRLACAHIMTNGLIMVLLDQEAVNTHIRAIFGIETGFQGTLVSQFAKVCERLFLRPLDSDI